MSSAEAKATFPMPTGGWHIPLPEDEATMIEDFQRAFDKGRSVSLAATREALAVLLSKKLGIYLDPRFTEHAKLIVQTADAIFAAGIIRDEPEVKAEALDEARLSIENASDTDLPRWGNGSWLDGVVYALDGLGHRAIDLRNGITA